MNERHPGGPEALPPTVFVVTGATGFVGTSLVPLLRGRGHRVVTVGRSGCDHDYAALATAPLPRGACWVHLAGKAHDVRATSDDADYERVNVDLTRSVWDEARRHGASHVVFVSSIKAVLDHADAPVDESHPPAPRTAYGLSKLRAEQTLTASAESPGAPPLTILRPCLVYGPGVKGNLRLLRTLVERRIPYPLGAFPNLRSVLSVRNLSHVIELTGCGELAAGLYHVADDEPVSTVTIIRAMADALGVRSVVLRVPVRLVRAAAVVGTRLRTPMTSERLEKLTESLVLDTRRLRTAMGERGLPESSRQGLTAAFARDHVGTGR